MSSIHSHRQHLLLPDQTLREDQARPEARDDALAPARGIGLAAVISVIFWAILAAWLLA
jgi:hypothetical protein